MKTLPREPWRGGQICGEQLEYGVVPGRSVFCGEFKMLGSPLCEKHDREAREDNYGVLPRFAEGNAMGLTLREIPGYGWGVYDVRERVIGTCPEERGLLAELYGFTLSWEPYDDGAPEAATEEEIAAWKQS